MLNPRRSIYVPNILIKLVNRGIKNPHILKEIGKTFVHLIELQFLEKSKIVIMDININTMNNLLNSWRII